MRWPWEREPLLPASLSLYPTAQEVKAAYEAEPAVPPIDDLPPLTTKTRCPKCRNAAVSIDYHRTGHTGCPDGRMNDWPGLFYTAENQAKYRRISESWVEHHDRKCCNCKYGWVEAVAA